MIRTTVFCLLVAIFASPLSAADPLPPIARRLPPKGLEIPAEVRRELEKELGEVKTKLAALSNGVEFEPDIAIYTKAVELALHFGEFYNAKHFDLAKASLATAKKRIAEMSQNNELSWRKARGLVVRGYRSEIDGSSQPYGLEIAEGIDLAKPTPLVVWLHGRGDQQTDLHFLADRAKGKSQFQIPGAIILHPFGRHCLGFKSAGEIDVLEAIEHVCREYSIDRNRIVMAGFSMGGAGSWHLGAHYADRWCAIAPGAGFAETRRYQNLDPAKVEWYERKLWGAYDVPDYARNLLHTPLIAYSGEIDKQKQAADVMAESLLSHGYKLRHLIGPKVGQQ